MLRENFPSEKYKQNQEVMKFYHQFKDPKIFQSYQCQKCQGEGCCKVIGCMYYPEDFKEVTWDTIKPVLEDGRASVSARFELDNNGLLRPILYIRSRGIEKGAIDLYSHATPCALLTDDGCPYKINERPLGGVLLLPKQKKNGECKNCVQAQNICAEEWKKYQSVLKKAVTYFSNHSLDKEVKEEVKNVVHTLYQKIVLDEPFDEEDVILVEPMIYFPDEYFGFCPPEEQMTLKIQSARMHFSRK